MKKNTKTNSKPQKIPFLERSMTRKQFILLCYIPLTIITGLLIMAGFYFREYYKANLDDPSVIRHFIVDAVEGLSSEAPIVSSNDKQFIPEMNLSFDRKTTKLAYFYNAKTEEAHESVIVTSVAIKRSSSSDLYSYQNANDLLESIPQYQACQRILILTTEDKQPTYYDGYQIIETVTTESKPIYIWKTSEKLCKFGDESNFEELLQTIRTAQSY